MSENDFGKAVSRILSSPLRAERIICLSSPYPEPVRFHERAASRCAVPYLALHPMGFAVPRHLRFERCALTAPFHPYRFAVFRLQSGGFFSVALSVEEPLGPVSRVYLTPEELSYAASRPAVFGLSSSRLREKRSSAFPKSCRPYAQHPGKARWGLEDHNLVNGIPRPCRRC